MSEETPLPRDTRRRDVLGAEGQTAFGPFDFVIWSDEDVRVLLDGTLLDPSDYVVAPTGDDYPSYFTITLDQPIEADDTPVRIEGARTHARELDVTQGGAVNSADIERELDKQTAVLQELRRDISGLSDLQAIPEQIIAQAEAARDAALAAAETMQEVVEAAAANLLLILDHAPTEADGADGNLAIHDNGRLPVYRRAAGAWALRGYMIGIDGAGAGDVISDDDPTVAGKVLVWSSNDKRVAGASIAELLSGAAFGPWSGMSLAGTVNIFSSGTLFVAITAGTGPITSFGTSKDDCLRIVRADVTFTVTRHATNLETPGAADLTVAAGDYLLVYRTSAESAGKTRVLQVIKGDGRAQRGPNDIPQNIALSGDITPSQITANQNDYSPAGLSTAAVLRLSTDASRNITGIAGGANGRLLTLYNVGSFPVVLKDADSGSSAANRLSNGADITIAASKCVTLRYDGTSSRWRPFAIVLPFGALALLDSVTDIPGPISFSGEITPSQITSNQNDYAPTGLSTASLVRLSTDASRNVTGISAPSTRRLLLAINVGSNNLVLKNADSGSSAANRFDFGGDRTLAGGDGALLLYDVTASRWRCLGIIATGGGGGGGTSWWGVNDGRLSFATGVYDMSAAVSAATSLFWVPGGGGQIGLYISGAWSVVTATEKSIKATDAQSCTTTNGNAQIVVADSDQLVVGMKASGTGIQASSVIASIDDATHVTLDKTANASGTNTVTFKLPADTAYDVYGKGVASALKLYMVARAAIHTAPTFGAQDGVVTKNADATMRHLGAVVTSGTDGQFDWALSGQRRFRCWNRDNRRTRSQVEGFTSGGTYYKPLGLVSGLCEIWGSSGGSAGSSSSGGAGGTTSLGSVLSVTGGSGGPRISATPPTAGSPTGHDFSLAGAIGLPANGTNRGVLSIGGLGGPAGFINDSVTGNQQPGGPSTYAGKNYVYSTLSASETVTIGAGGTTDGSGIAGKSGLLKMTELVEF